MKCDQIRVGNCKDGSGVLVDPGKEFFLKLAADSIRDLNSELDKNGMNDATTAMVQCGMLMGVDGSWPE